MHVPAVILSTPLVRQYLINYARPLIYTTALSFPALAAIRSAYLLLSSGALDPPRQRLHSLILRLHAALRSHLPPPPLPSPSSPLSPQILGASAITLPEVPWTPTPILALLTPRPRELAAFLQRCGFLARPIVYPTVKIGTERVRICVHADNTELEVDALAMRVGEWARAQTAGVAATEVETGGSGSGGGSSGGSGQRSGESKL